MSNSLFASSLSSFNLRVGSAPSSSWWESAWNDVVSWSQDFVLSLNGDAIFWTPVILLIAGVLCLWVLTAIKPMRVFGWLVSAVLIASSVLTWTHVWDWRAGQYETELADSVVGTDLVGTTVEAENVGANAFGVLELNLQLEYEFGFAEVFVIEDTEELIDRLVLESVLNSSDESVDDNYLSAMRSFQELHVNVQSPQNDNFDETLAYGAETLNAYAGTVRLRSVDDVGGNGDTDNESSSSSENGEEDELGDSGYSFIHTDGSAWLWADAQASEDGIELGQWTVLQNASGALDSINDISCAVLNGFDECGDDGDGVGPASTVHSTILLAVLFFGIIVGAILLEVILRTWTSVRRSSSEVAESDADNGRDINRAAGRKNAFRKNANSTEEGDGVDYQPRRVMKTHDGDAGSSER